MESIGDKLKRARDTRGVSIEQAARDTHIAKRFVEALETEAFDEFPGEAYLLGFLRNYSGYLGLDAEDVVALYHNLKLQEQPAPISELLDRRPEPRNIGRIALIVGLVAVLAVIVALFVTGVIPVPDFSAARQAAAEEEETARTTPFILEEQFVERRFVQGDRVSVPIDGQPELFEFVSIGERISIGSEAGIVQLGPNEERVLDITGEGSGDISLAIRQVYADDDPPAVVVRVDRVVTREPVAAGPAAAEVTDADRETLAIGQTIEESRERPSVVIASFPTVQEYFIEADIQGFTMMRWQADDQPMEERYLQNGDRIRTSVRQFVRVWTSNAGNVRLRVAGNPVELGGQGEVIAAVIRWTETPAGTFQLELLPLY